MIPRDFITEWRKNAPWVLDSQVEQDLVICRALVEIFNLPGIRERFIFRGGTALYKLYARRPVRYSEDIDLVQAESGPIGDSIDMLRSGLDPWLGQPQRNFKEGTINLSYRFSSEGNPPINLRLKVEINTREHFAVHKPVARNLFVQSRWFSGNADIQTYTLNELLGTKTRALFQRKKGRDLFDLWYFLEHEKVDAGVIADCFLRYMKASEMPISRAVFEKNLALKLEDSGFISDTENFIVPDIRYDIHAAGQKVKTLLISRLPGSPWKGKGRKKEGGD